MTNCGPGSESCCTSLQVTGGTYYRTYTNSGSGATGEADQATVSSFRLDKYLVTVGRFRQFVNAWNGGAGWLPPVGAGKHTHLNGGNGLNVVGGGYESGWVTTDNINIAPTNANLASCGTYSTWTSSVGSQENLPMNCINWWEAYAFCIWDSGAFLPSEAEWEYAAAGGNQQREYPWGSTPPGTASQYAIINCDYPSGTCIGIASFAPVGTATLGAALWGQLDMAGELYEWNIDWYAAYGNPCTDCAYLTSGSYRVMRGADISSGLSNLLPPLRLRVPPVRESGRGVRCSRTP
jgi:formylglycine-generating enzyme required for sulfatase activity